MSGVELLCAHQNEGITCNEAKFTCTGCRLVHYCRPKCQQDHWAKHKANCKSPYMKKSWKPLWYVQGRDAAFEDQGFLNLEVKYLWGNTPAIDILVLEKHEDVSNNKDLHILFAASSDIRNLRMTIASLPIEYRQTVNITANDLDTNVTARNVILLLIAFAVEEPGEAVDCKLHVWFAAQLTRSHFELLDSKIRPLNQEALIQSPYNRIHTWNFGNHSVWLTLTQSAWSSMLDRLQVPDGLTSSKARNVRGKIARAESRVDYLDRGLFDLPPAHRMGLLKYRNDSIILPFDHPRSEFIIPNLARYRSLFADALRCWAHKNVLSTSSGLASNDLYGKLCYHVKDVLRRFVAAYLR
ncbi:hypothetical protein BT63DRAFT_366383 [Microthyrium microscopicum]|uniref:MYND-type domain-containing protein n=1 Tax=Microthyrium microscopicum TaxID=703497 RepID=A0A6A6UT80_9PEZI|nr:hypothetical protein BT63DRAFT_366383 [Microthyrium microscopicum]